MKRNIIKSVICTLIILWPFISYSQIPNADFEHWTQVSSMLIPDNWAFMAIEGVAIPVRPTTNSHSGNYAIYGEVMDNGTLPPFSLISPTSISVPTGSEDIGFAVSERHAVLSGFYQFGPVEGDKLVISVNMFNDTTAIGIGKLNIESIASTYTPFSVNISYFTEETPDMCLISVTIHGPASANDYHEGSYYIIDDLSFDSPVTVFEINGDLDDQFVLNQNYPNPFSGDTEIHFQVPSPMNVKIKIFNILGQEIFELADRKFESGKHTLRWNGRDYNGNKVAKGIYFYRLQSGELSQAKKMYLTR
jgi:hypothetical protein